MRYFVRYVNFCYLVRKVTETPDVISGSTKNEYMTQVCFAVPDVLPVM